MPLLKKSAAPGAAGAAASSTLAAAIDAVRGPSVELKPDPLNFVVVRIWTAVLDGQQVSPARFAAASDLTNQDSIGHATLMVVKNGFKFRYLSLWPADQAQILHRPSALIESPADDEAMENGNAPDATYVFFSLDHARLWAATKLSALKDRFPSWSLGGSKKITNPGRKVRPAFGNDTYRQSESCSSAVYALLKEAGILQLPTQTRFSTSYIISHPNNLRDYLADAQAEERKLFTATAGSERNLSSHFRDRLLALTDKTTFKSQLKFVSHLLSSVDKAQCDAHFAAYGAAAGAGVTPPVVGTGADGRPAIPARPGHGAGPRGWPALFKMVGLEPAHLAIVGAGLVGFAASKIPTIELEYRDLLILLLLTCVVALGVKQCAQQQTATPAMGGR